MPSPAQPRPSSTCRVNDPKLTTAIDQINDFTLWSRNLLGNQEIQFEERVQRLENLVTVAAVINDTLNSITVGNSSVDGGVESAKQDLQDSLNTFTENGAKGLKALAFVRNETPSSLRSFHGSTLRKFISNPSKPHANENHVTDQLPSIAVFMKNLLKETTLLCGDTTVTEAHLIVEHSLLRQINSLQRGSLVTKSGKTKASDSIQKAATYAIDLMVDEIWKCSMGSLETCLEKCEQLSDATNTPRLTLPDRPRREPRRHPPCLVRLDRRLNGEPI
jgi:hypothetical protein